MFRPTRILVPTDMSGHADKAVGQALEIARQFNAEMFMLHVVQDHVQQCTVDYCMDASVAEQLQTQVIAGARTGVQRQVQRLLPDTTVGFTTDVKIGVPYEEILREAQERNVDLIVISSLGSSGLGKYMIGSVARHVLLGATCPVLLVR